jgi:SAM-dependent methyltransferase
MLTKLILKELLRDGLRLVRDRRVPMGMLSGDFNKGHCPICQCPAIFIKRAEWLRDNYQCIRCHSIPRWRALIYVLETHFPNWRESRIHESSPGGASSQKLSRECKHYTATHFFQNTPAGETKHGYRCENLESQTFGDGEFDLVITQDVFEHILNPSKAFAEVARTLKPGGAHVFTIPWYYWKKTLIRAVDEHGTVRHLEQPERHGNPIDPNGSLVVTEWGWDLCDFIHKHSGLGTTVVKTQDRQRGIDADFIEVFVSRKQSPIGAIDTRELYLDLMKRCLIDLIYSDVQEKPNLQLHPFDELERLEGRDWPTYAHTMIGMKRLDNLQSCIEDVLAKDIPGDFIETGAWRGGATIFMRAMLKAYGSSNRSVWVADSFEGLPLPNAERYSADAGDHLNEFKELAVSLDQVKSNFAKYDLLDNQVRFLKGWFRDTLPNAPIGKLAVMRLDGDMYESTMDALVHLYPKLSKGGYVIVDDYGCFANCRQAVHDYREANGITDQIREIDWSGVYWERS